MSLSKNNNDRIAEIVESVLERDPSERAEFFEKACRDNVDLRKEVESLLRFAETATDFIEKPAYEIAAETIIDPGGELKAGEKLGEYKILSLIGEGGMGEVYLAEDTKLGRKVAIKLLKFGLGTSNIIRHFQQEERILAGLSHSNVAQLFGGAVTPAGLPYSSWNMSMVRDWTIIAVTASSLSRNASPCSEKSARLFPMPIKIW